VIIGIEINQPNSADFEEVIGRWSSRIDWEIGQPRDSENSDV
jgi:hypothetical protein